MSVPRPPLDQLDRLGTVLRFGLDRARKVDGQRLPVEVRNFGSADSDNLSDRLFAESLGLLSPERDGDGRRRGVAQPDVALLDLPTARSDRDVAQLVDTCVQANNITSFEVVQILNHHKTPNST